MGVGGDEDVFLCIGLVAPVNFPLKRFREGVSYASGASSHGVVLSVCFWTA